MLQVNRHEELLSPDISSFRPLDLDIVRCCEQSNGTVQISCNSSIGELQFHVRSLSCLETGKRDNDYASLTSQFETESSHPKSHFIS